MKTRSAIAMAVCCFSGLAHAELVVELNAATMIPNSSAAAKTEFLLNTSTPVITGSNLSGYTGPDIYVGVANSREENARIKEGDILEDWPENKRRRKDVDTRWTNHFKLSQSQLGIWRHLVIKSESDLVSLPDAK